MSMYLVVDDFHNNVGRHCDVIGVRTETSRQWRVVQPLKQSGRVGSVTHYLLANSTSGQELIASADNLTNLY